MLRLRKGGRLAFGWALSSLIAAAVLLPLTELLGMPAEAPYGVLWASGIAFAAFFSRLLPRPARGLARLALLAALGAYLLPRALPLLQAAAAGLHFQTAALLHSDALALFLAALAASFGLLLASGDAAFGAPLILTAAMMLWLSGARSGLARYLPAALSLPMLFIYTRPAGEAPGYMDPATGLKRRALPLALLAALLAMLLTPAQEQAYPPMAQKAKELRQLINDYFFFTDSRQAFSLRGEGWQPLGDAGLGGVPQVPDTPVLEVRAASKTYLRGSIRDTYNGRSWYDTVSQDRYGFFSPRFAALRDGILDAALPRGHALPRETASVHVLRDSTSTLFVPQRLRSLTPGSGLVPYFNLAGEVFVTRNLKAGDSYTVAYENYTAGDAVRAMAAALANTTDTRYADVRARYSVLPAHLAGDSIVSNLARTYMGAADTPYLMAENIMRGLQRDYRYTLDVPDTPGDIDFAAHFLFQSRAGYCTYFATAMVVLARSVGLPARYIEGFVAQGTGEPETLTSRSAHAWAEVYIPAMGWVVFDATAPENGQGGPAPSGGQGPDGQGPEQTPEPTATPQPTPGPENAEASDQPSAAPPSPSPEPTTQPGTAPGDAPPPAEKPTPPFPWLALLLTALAALAGWRLYAVSPAAREKKAADDTQRLLVWWRAYLAAQKAGGRGMEDSETLTAYARRAGGDDAQLQSLLAAVAAVLYGRKTASRQAADAMRARCRAAVKALHPLRRPAYYMSGFAPTKAEAAAALRALRRRKAPRTTRTTRS